MKKNYPSLLKKMHKFFFVFIFNCNFYALAASDDETTLFKESLIPLNNFINKENIKDYATQEYILTRCSANFRFIAILLKTNGAKHEDVFNDAMFFVQAAMEIRKLNNIMRNNIQTDKGILAGIAQAVKIITDKYINDSNAHYLTSGSHFTGSYIDGDRVICKKINSNLIKFLNGQLTFP